MGWEEYMSDKNGNKNGDNVRPMGRYSKDSTYKWLDTLLHTTICGPQKLFFLKGKDLWVK